MNNKISVIDIKRLAKNRNIRFMGGFDNRDVAQIFSEIDITDEY